MLKFSYSKSFGGGGSNLSSLSGISADAFANIHSKKSYISFSKKGFYQAGFTLAEVLITLGIIGVVAALTLPALIQKNQDKELVSRTKAVYSNIQNAVLKSQSDYGVIGDNSLLFSPNNTSFQTAEAFSKYFNGARVCKTQSDKGCSKYYYAVKYGSLRLSSDNSGATESMGNWPKIVLNNGAIIAISQYKNPDCYAEETVTVTDEYGRPLKNPDGTNQTSIWHNKRCAIIRFDVNGAKKPNQFGRDVYSVSVMRDGKLSPDSSGPAYGVSSLLNILAGNEKLEYTNYSSSQKYDF